MVKNLPAMRGDLCSDPWVRKICWRRAWQPTPAFLPGESPWSLEDYSPWSKDSDRTDKHSTAHSRLTML